MLCQENAQSSEPVSNMGGRGGSVLESIGPTLSPCLRDLKKGLWNRLHLANGMGSTERDVTGSREKHLEINDDLSDLIPKIRLESHPWRRQFQSCWSPVDPGLLIPQKVRVLGILIFKGHWNPDLWGL